MMKWKLKILKKWAVMQKHINDIEHLILTMPDEVEEWQSKDVKL